jgi:hypothetical protein
MNMIVWIVEHRKINWQDCIMYVASTREKAVAYCRENLDADTGDDWCYMISENEVDGDGNVGELFYVNSSGTEYVQQPMLN